MREIDNMNGYDFEELIGNLFRKMGFSVEHTALSGDGGVDIIAYSNDVIFKGKYLIQCKRYSSSVGEPPVRDLYGVVLSENANKGIMITNSYFTQQAKDFAEGKNIELIDGNNLNILLSKYLDIDSKNVTTDNYIEMNDFDSEKYQYLKNLVDNDIREAKYHKNYFKFLYSYIENKSIDIMYSGLLHECVREVNDIIRRFGKRSKAGQSLKETYSYIDCCFDILLGSIDKVFEKTKLYGIHNISNEYASFTSSIWKVIHSISSPLDSTIEKRNGGTHHILLINMLIILNNHREFFNILNINDYIVKLFSDNFEYQKKKFEDEKHHPIIGNFSHILREYEKHIECIEKNNDDFNARIKEIYEMIDNKIYIPNISTTFDGLDIHINFSSNLFFEAPEIMSKWSSDINMEKQIKRIEFLMTV